MEVSQSFASRRHRPSQANVLSTTHMWTAPPCKNFFDDFDRIACVHMSGLLVRSHMNAGQDGFRHASSKQRRDLRRPLGRAECLAFRIDRSHHLLVSCKFTHQLSTVASLILLTVTGRFLHAAQAGTGCAAMPL